MGLTIHWELELIAPKEIVIEKLYELNLYAKSFEDVEVKDMITLTGSYTNFNGQDDPLRWFKTLAQCGSGKELKEVIGFEAFPGEGCEPVVIMLCKYGKEKTWKSKCFCKTQYASNPSCGGVKNFLKCHKFVISILDKAKKLHILKHVNDEGNYWTKRDDGELRKEIGEWNCFTAKFAGVLKDACGDNVSAPILEYDNFEHLEMGGE